MATPKTKPAAAAVPEYDFDNWSEEAEEKAIAAAVPEVKYIIVEKRFIGRLGDGTIIEVPLTLSFDFIDQLQADYSTPIDQFKAILTEIGGEAISADFGKRDMVEGAILAEKYFRVLQRVQQAAFPE
ncbi:hypothetical protein [Microbacterium algeriense]|uniref:Tail assembly chaperone n=1 Tax=Microbacterium algeriense TaxID=2615184 RepID=A0ABQ6VB69_9MICO|nr:hypothetical protein [Microbacterium algeriense]KAB1867337.1 hypothetical protein F6A08_06000 [Microbacterium algeriense]